MEMTRSDRTIHKGTTKKQAIRGMQGKERHMNVIKGKTTRVLKDN